MDPILRRQKWELQETKWNCWGAAAVRDATCQILVVCLLRVASDFLSRSFQVNLISVQHLLG